MKLNHIALSVTNVIQSKEFFETFFGFNCLTLKPSIAILKDSQGLVFVLHKSKNEENIEYPEDFHIGFLLDSAEEVRQIYKKLKSVEHDFLINITEIKDNNHGIIFYFNAPGKILVEVSCRNTF